MSSPALAPIPPSEVLHVIVKKLKRRNPRPDESLYDLRQKSIYPPRQSGDRYDFSPVREWFETHRKDFGLTWREVMFLNWTLFEAVNNTQSIPPLTDLAERANYTTRTVSSYLKVLKNKIPMLYDVVLIPWLTAAQKISILEAL